MGVWKSMKRYFKHHPFVLILCIICIAAFTILTLAPPMIMRYFIDKGLAQNDKEIILKLAILYFGSYIVMNIFNFGRQALLAVISQGISKQIRLDMLKKVNKLDYVSFTRFDAGTLEAYFSNDVDAIDKLITSGVVSFVTDSFKLIGILIAVFSFSILFGVITLASFPIIGIIIWIFKNKMMKVQLRTRRLEGNVNNSILENLENIHTIKSFRVYDNVSDRYNEVLKNHFITAEKTNLYDAMFSPIIQMLKGIAIALIIVLASYKLSWFGMTVGMVVAGIDYITDSFQPIEKLGDEIQTIQKSLAGIRRISEFFKLPEDMDKNMSIGECSSYKIEFKDVTYSYDGKVNVLENFNLTISGNEHLTLEGRSGAGKSTIFKLAYGIIAPTKGEVVINGVPAYMLNDSARQKLFGIVYQDYFFTSKTIREEVSLERNITDERIYEVLRMCGLSRIDDINKMLITTDYSSGELSLFNIARAILLDADILFLDEMNAKIDVITANMIIDVINKIGKNKMIISINHYGNLIEDSKVLHVGQ